MRKGDVRIIVGVRSMRPSIMHDRQNDVRPRSTSAAILLLNKACVYLCILSNGHSTTANPCAQSVNSSPAEPVLSRSSRQRLGHLQSHFDRGWHVCQAVFPELQPAAVCRRIERRDGAHEALPRLQSACSWLVME